MANIFSPFAAGVMSHSPARILYWFRNNHRAVVCISNIAIIRSRISPGFRTFWLSILTIPTYTLTPTTTVCWFIISPSARGTPTIRSWFGRWCTPTRSLCSIIIWFTSWLIQPSVLGFSYWWSISLYWRPPSTPGWWFSGWSISSLSSLDRRSRSFT